jgi:hypothetical protein
MTAAMKAVADKALWEARAITLAEEQHLIHRASYLGQGVYGENLREAPSKTTDCAVYVVHVWPVNEAACCSCLAAWFTGGLRPLWRRDPGRATETGGREGREGREGSEDSEGSEGSEGDTALRWFCHGGEW